MEAEVRSTGKKQINSTHETWVGYTTLDAITSIYACSVS